jgi:SPOR domain
VPKNTELASKEELIDAAYQHLTKSWYNLKDVVSVLGTLTAIITAVISLYISSQGQIKAVEAKAKAGDAFIAAENAKTKAGDAKTKAGDAFIAAENAKTKAGDATAKAGDAFIVAEELERDRHKAAVDVAKPIEKIFVYTSTFFVGKRDNAFADARRTQKVLDEAGIKLKSKVYVRDDKKRWAVVIGDPAKKIDAQDLINKLKKTANLSAYPNVAKRWKLDINN